jgi:hypothetical protein
MEEMQQNRNGNVSEKQVPESEMIREDLDEYIQKFL